MGNVNNPSVPDLGGENGVKPGNADNVQKYFKYPKLETYLTCGEQLLIHGSHEKKGTMIIGGTLQKQGREEQKGASYEYLGDDALYVTGE